MTRRDLIFLFGYFGTSSSLLLGSTIETADTLSAVAMFSVVVVAITCLVWVLVDGPAK